MKLKNIYTVVVHSLAGDEDSTVSFERWEDAVGYITGEELAEAGASEEEIEECKEFLENERNYTYGDWEYTIYDAKLVLAPTEGDNGRAS